MKLKKSNLLIFSTLGIVLLVVGIAGIIFDSKMNSSCTPFNVFLSKNGDNGVKISWKTEDSCLGYVLYGESSYEIERVGIDIDNLGKTKSHEVVVSSLLRSNLYHFLVISNEQPYGNNGKPVAFSLTDLNQ